MSYLNLKYTRKHQWVNVNGDTAVIGYTEFAVKEMGKVLYVEFPEVGQVFEKDDELGSVESENAITDCLSPLSGTVIEINNLLTDEAELINEHPFGEGWLVKIRYTNASELSNLMNYQDYQDYLNYCTQ